MDNNSQKVIIELGSGFIKAGIEEEVCIFPTIVQSLETHEIGKKTSYCNIGTQGNNLQGERRLKLF